MDVSCLLSTLAARLRIGTPELTPGKTEVSFEQWYHEVQCIKDHYAETVVQESIIRLLKGQWWIWPVMWDPLLALTISCGNVQ